MVERGGARAPWLRVPTLCLVLGACGGAVEAPEPDAEEVPIEVSDEPVAAVPARAQLDLCVGQALSPNAWPSFLPVPDSLRPLTYAECAGDRAGSSACSALTEHQDPRAKWNASAEPDAVLGFAGGKLRAVLVAEALGDTGSLKDVVRFYGANLNQNGWMLMEYEHTTLVARRADDCVATFDIKLQQSALQVVVTLQGR